MIPGVLRGVIASSWLRASDQLRAPNAITTGQDIPAVEIVERQEPRHEGYFGSQVTLVSSSTRDARVMIRPVLVPSYTYPARVMIRPVLVVKRTA